MLLINFSHPISNEQVTRIECVLGCRVDRLINCNILFNQSESFEEQSHDLIESLGLSSEDWQSQQIVINPPPYSYIALLILAKLHGYMGHFPIIIRIRPCSKSIPTYFEFAEIIDLQEARQRTRKILRK